MKRFALTLAFAVAATLPAAFGQAMGSGMGSGTIGRAAPSPANPGRLGTQSVTPQLQRNRGTARRGTASRMGTANRSQANRFGTTNPGVSSRRTQNHLGTGPTGIRNSVPAPGPAGHF